MLRFIQYWCLAHLLCTVTGTIEEDNDQHCQVLYTYGYGFFQFFHLPTSALHSGGLIMRFSVRARSDAHLLLSTSPSPLSSDPVYEIVLGAGRNSFSDIRRLRRAASRATSTIKDLLSETELREFWVRLTMEGMIQVGRVGEELPFLFWQDTNPLDIRYFSFCTWTGVPGKWLYDCKQEIGAVNEPNMTWTQVLRKDLFTHYNPYSYPNSDNVYRTPVEVEVLCGHVTLDTKASIIAVQGAFVLRWKDPKLIWDPEHYGRVQVVHVAQHEIWHPELIVYNAVDVTADHWGSGLLQVSREGVVEWSPSVDLRTWCHLDVSAWPWDTQTCPLQLGFWSQQDALQMMLVENATTLDKQQTHSEWKVVGLEAETTWIDTPWLEQDVAGTTQVNTNPQALTIKLTIHRQAHAYCWLLLVPLLAMLSMMLAGFWIEPLCSEKLCLHCLLLLTLGLFMITVDRMLPPVRDHTPYILLMYNRSMVAALVSTLVTIAGLCVTKSEHLQSPPRLVVRALLSGYTTTLLWLPLPRTQDQQEYGFLNDASDSSEQLYRKLDDTAASVYWSLLTIALQRVMFLIIFTSLVGIFLL